jgi:hypothetical protein
MRKILSLTVILSMLPVAVSAQSLEWLAEHQGAVPAAVSQLVTTTPAVVNTNDGLEQKVRAYFSDAPIMAEIARCESRFRQFSDSGNPLDGGAGGMMGLFQVNSHVHAAFAKSLGMDINTVDGNLAYARYLYQREGTNPWLSSFSCWHNASATNAAPNTLSQDLLLGTISPEVKALQVMLNSKGYMLASEGPGSPGQETEKFGSLTRIAVRKFQCAVMRLCSGDEHGTGYGMVGEKTRLALLGAVAVAVTEPPKDDSAEISRLQQQIAELAAQLFELKKKLGQV